MMCVLRRRLAAAAVLVAGLVLTLCPSAFGEKTAPNSRQEVMNHLNLVLRWSRQWSSADLSLTRPGDELYVENGRSIVQEVVNLEFQSALAQAVLIGESSGTAAPSRSSSQNGAEAQNALKAQQSVTLQLTQLQAELDAVNRRIPSAGAKNREALLTERGTLEGQLQLAQALQDNLHKLTAFMTTEEIASGAATELTAKITALQRTVPGAATSRLPAMVQGKDGLLVEPGASAPVIASPQNEGLIGQLAQMVRMLSSLRALDGLEDDSARLQTATQQLRAPLLVALRATLQQGQIEIASTASSPSATAQSGQASPAPLQPVVPASAAAPQTAQSAVLKQRAMKDLVQRFKLLSKATMPLSQELILVDQSQANLTQLQASMQHDYIAILRTLLLRVALILIALGLIWLFSEVWRRATFRYIHDARRRRQFLVLRRVVTGFCMSVVILLGFISDFSSLATYAGLITAGIAVALQAVILSIAAYFFLVGRYGVKVGDRVTVVYNGANSVAGDVVDIGLVRFYMMELAGSGIDMQPTGRICVFPNSVLFQTNPLFKQIPGTEYAWREVALPLHAESDVQLAEKELLAAVSGLYSGYRPALEKQHFNIESTMGVHMDAPKPYSKVRFVGSGLEVIARYPVPLRQAAELDDRVVMEVSEILRKNPSIRLAAGAAPDLRSPVKV